VCLTPFLKVLACFYVKSKFFIGFSFWYYIGRLNDFFDGEFCYVNNDDVILFDRPDVIIDDVIIDGSNDYWEDVLESFSIISFLVNFLLFGNGLLCLCFFVFFKIFFFLLLLYFLVLTLLLDR